MDEDGIDIFKVWDNVLMDGRNFKITFGGDGRKSLRLDEIGP